MKIGVIGLRPRQIAELQHRNLKVDIAYYGDKNQTAEQIGRFASDKDHVLVMAGHVARPVHSAIPSTKRHVMTGSISSVIRFIEDMLPNQPLVAEEEVVTTETVEAEASVDTAPPPTPVERKVARAINVRPKPEAPAESDFELVSQVPRGYKSLYKQSMSPKVTVGPDSNGRIDYAPLRAMAVGEVLRSKRPAGIERAQWLQRIHALRSYYGRTLKIMLEAHFYPTYVDLLVLDTKRSSHGLEEKVVDTIEPTSPPEPEVPVQYTDEERGFWSQSFLLVLGSGLTPSEAAARADESLKEFRTRFPAA